MRHQIKAAAAYFAAFIVCGGIIAFQDNPYVAPIAAFYGWLGVGYIEHAFKAWEAGK